MPQTHPRNLRREKEFVSNTLNPVFHLITQANAASVPDQELEQLKQ